MKRSLIFPGGELHTYISNDHHTENPAIAVKVFQKIKDIVNLVHNMGWRYVIFRSKYELLLRSGLLKHKFPVRPLQREFLCLEKWKQLSVHFFFEDKNSIKLCKKPAQELKQKYLDLLNGKFLFFGGIHFDLGKDYDWVTNPSTGYVYDNQKHWTEIADFSKEAGDIKYVWEKSRFSFIYDIIRYDYHFDHDCSEIVFAEIISWIRQNPINCGPNYRCSQEISLRVLNWIFALYYYKNSPALTNAVFQQILNNVYWQLKHVYSNINFSRKAVRNNHAITETMALYICGIVFPFFSEAATWRKKGKKWFEQEVAYQVYPDGTFLQYSMNYHRVVIQLLTWGIRLSDLNNEILDKAVKDRAIASLHFLFNCMDLSSGYLPNYGANDGALFFPLNDRDFRDYRPQLSALSLTLSQGLIDDQSEDPYWFGVQGKAKETLMQKEGMLSYPKGGYYLLREKNTFSFIRCGNHKDRPSQADNLHLDLWVNGMNILCDGGSYKYNTAEEILHYFFGTASHNTVMLGPNDQMKKGKRFIWYNWTQSINASWTEYENYFEFTGAIKAFQQINPNIVHRRTVRKYKSELKWEVIDEVDHTTFMEIYQLWHTIPFENIQKSFTAFDGSGIPLKGSRTVGWHSPKYGIKEETEMLVFKTEGKQIRTIIDLKVNKNENSVDTSIFFRRG
jgi:hypothetical protein